MTDQTQTVEQIANPILPYFDEAARAKFWSRIKGDPTQCWEWNGSKSGSGYGRVAFGRKGIRTHRAAWALAHNREPGHLFVCHRCDNPPCCNPDHLFLGTNADNVRDMVAKGRHVSPDRDETTVKHPKGEDCYQAKLTEAKVREIRRLQAAGLSYSKIASRYGVDKTLAWLVAKRRIWKHVA